MSDHGALFGFKAPKPPSQKVNRNDTHKRVRMSEDTYEDGNTNYNYLEKQVDIDDLVIPSLNIDNLEGDGDSNRGKGNAKPLQMKIAELEVEILTPKRVFLQI